MAKCTLSGLIFLAVLLGNSSCMAQTAEAQIYGVLDQSVMSRQLSGSARTTELANRAMQTSFIGFRGDEDLGDGLGAQFVLES